MDQKKLLEEFEMLRKEMNKLGRIFGLDHSKVLELSRKIDRIHNELSKIQKNK
ncbi:aspartyl-phosphate phosphatase Spo0E family protein [Bacillus methanolicus]|jgi:chromosomal replication initiation ATPase DnaA|uniref:Spo0E family sporulation regulatory protein-aspartic acid phosphatase n=1 Tax=Robertmurraya sp. DFI.2.37 TaxID=3031819 RepID=UPI001248EFDD